MGGQSSKYQAVRAQPKGIVPKLLDALNELMEWEEKLPAIQSILASKGLTSHISSSLTGERDINPETIVRDLQHPSARSTTALVHTATSRDVHEQEQDDSEIPGPVITSSDLFGEVAMSEVAQSAKRLAPIPPVERLPRETLEQSTHDKGEKPAQTFTGITSSVYPGLSTTYAARVLGLTHHDLKSREQWHHEIDKLGNSPEMKARIMLICKYLFIHCLLQKLVRSSEHCYKLQQKQTYETRHLSSSLGPLERVQTERRLDQTIKSLTSALGNHDNARRAVDWLRQDFLISGALYDVNTSLALAQVENRETRMLNQQKSRILLDLHHNEMRALNVGLYYLDKNWDGVLDAEEVPMLSARLFAILDRDRTHAITPQNLQAAAMEANDRLAQLSDRLHQLTQDAEALKNRPGEAAFAQLHRVEDERERVTNKKTELMAVVRSIVRYFHRAFTLHLFSKLDDKHIKVEPVDAKSLFRVMDDVMLSTYFDPVKPSANYFTKDEQQQLLYDTLGPMKTGMGPSRRSVAELADVSGSARLERDTAEGELVPLTQLPQQEQQRLLQVSRAYPTAPPGWDQPEMYEGASRERELQQERARDVMLRDVERRDVAAREAQFKQQQQQRQRDTELVEKQREQDMKREHEETAYRARADRQRQQERIRGEEAAREQQMRQQQQQQEEQDMLTRRRQQEAKQEEQMRQRQEQQPQREAEAQEANMKQRQQQAPEQQRRAEAEEKHRRMAGQAEAEEAERKRQQQQQQQQQLERQREAEMKERQRQAQEQRAEESRRRTAAQAQSQAQAEAEAEAEAKEAERQRQQQQQLLLQREREAETKERERQAQEQRRAEENRRMQAAAEAEDAEHEKQHQQEQQRDREREYKYQRDQQFEHEMEAERERERERWEREAIRQREAKAERERQLQLQIAARQQETQRQQRQQHEAETRRHLEAQAQAEAERDRDHDGDRDRDRDRAAQQEEVGRQPRRVAEYPDQEHESEYPRQHEREREYESEYGDRDRDRDRDPEYFQTRLAQQEQPTAATTKPTPTPTSTATPTRTLKSAAAPAQVAAPVLAPVPTGERITYHDIPRDKSWLARERDEAATHNDRDVLTPMRVDWGPHAQAQPLAQSEGPLDSKEAYPRTYNHEYEGQGQGQGHEKPTITQRLEQAIKTVLGGGAGTGTDQATEQHAV